MKFKVIYVNLTKLLLATISALLIVTCVVIYLSMNKIVEKTSHLFAISYLFGMIGSFLYFFLWNDGIRYYIICNNGIQAHKMLIPWDEIKNYTIKDDSLEFKILKIKTTTGKELKIAHRKKFRLKDDFEDLIVEFEKAIKKTKTSHQIVKKPLIWDTKLGKWYGGILILIILIFSILLITKEIKATSLGNYLILLGLSIPLLVRIFRK